MRRSKMKTYKFGDYEKDILKAFSMVCSSEINRINIVGIYCEKNENDEFHLVACDGHILLKKKIDSSFWCRLRAGIKKEFGAMIPENIEEGVFYYSKLSRTISEKSIFEKKEDLNFWNSRPKFENLIPKVMDSKPEDRPTFSFQILARIEKILKIVGDNTPYFYPKWCGPLSGATYETEGGVLILAMPLRVQEFHQ